MQEQDTEENTREPEDIPPTPCQTERQRKIIKKKTHNRISKSCEAATKDGAQGWGEGQREVRARGAEGRPPGAQDTGPAGHGSTAGKSKVSGATCAPVSKNWISKL